MNKIYRLIWNELTQTWVAVTELARARGKRSHRALSLVSLLPLLILPGVGLAQPPPNALPTGGQVVGGQASINQSGTTMTIQQGSDRAAINWQDFNIGSQAKVNFQQPSSSAIALNRVLSGNPSQIYGQLNANGQVFLSNSAGVFFAPGSSANVGGLVATTHDMAPSDFMAGSTLFSRNGSTASVVNEGKLAATSGGYIALLAPEVRNHGLVLARKGTAALAAGETFELEFQGRQLANVRVTPSKVRALVENRQAVEAPGGQIILSAHAANSLQGSVVNSGKIEARGLSKQGGRIILGASGSVRNSGKISANARTAGNGKAKGKGKSQKNQQLASGQASSIQINAPKVTNSGQLTATGKKGGKVIITGDELTLKNGSQIDVSGTHGGGQALIGGDWQGSGDLYQATRVTMEQGANINASATVNGDGGKVVLWSDIHNPYSITYAYGSVTAQGGAEGGNGGQVETSGHEVDIGGFSVNTLAEQGQSGKWLLDPYDYNIDTTAANTISNALNGSTSVYINTANNTGAGAGASGNGDIVVNAAITKTSGNYAILSLQAVNTIAINKPITSTSDKLKVELKADTDWQRVGAIIVNANIETNGGDVVFGQYPSPQVGYIGGNTYFGRNPDNHNAPTHIKTKGGEVSFFGHVLVANPNGFTIDSRVDATGSDPAAGDIIIRGNINSANSYELVNNPLTWEQALIEAKTGSGANVGDTYLATITSALENAVASYYVKYTPSWLGGQRVTGLTDTTLPHTNDETTSSTYNINSIWRWVAGPEGLMNVDGNNGLPFFAQNGSNSANGTGGFAIAGRYTNWNRAGTGNPEPNNSTGSSLLDAKETVIQLVETAGYWNDLPKNDTLRPLPYIKETNLAPADLTINAGSTGGGTVTFGGGIGTEKPINVLVIKGDKINFPNPPQVNSSNTTVDGTVYAGGQQKNPVFVYAPTMTAQYGDSISYTATCSGSNCGSYNMNNVMVTPSATVKNVGIYGLTASGLSAQGSDLIFYSSGQLTLNQANLYLTANDVSRVYGEANPAFSTTLTGFKYTDTDATVITGSAGSTTTAATNTSNVGSYAITPSKGDYSVINSNYTLVLQNGTLTITQAPLTVSGVSANNKTYDGATTAYFSGGTLNGLKFSDAVTIGSISGNFSDKNIDDDKPVTVDGISLSGAKAGNYIVTSNPSGLTANITRLNSVDWTGAGNDNNWFNPANWAGGAIPDLANVANVVLPTVVNVQFDTTQKTGLAETGTVQLDSLTQSGANAAFTQADGILQVGTGGIQLGALTQTGGSLSSSGNVTLGAFTQTAGTSTFNSNLTVSNNFAQTGAGTVAITNEADITDDDGELRLGNLTAGSLKATSTGGNITQTGVLTIGGASTLTATGHDITLDNDGNDFGGAVTIEGKDISLKDKNDLTVASATASGNLTTESTGNTSFGTANVDGNLTTTSDGNTEFGNTSVGGNLSSDAQGNITQTNGATLTVTGTSELASGQGITLANDGNDFGGAVTVEGGNISLKDKNDLTVASATASGNLTTESTGNTSFGTANVDGNLTTTSDGNTEFGNTSVGGNLSSDAQGNITQTNGATLTVTGTSELTSGQDITLANDGNDFGGAVTVEGNNISLKDNNDLTLASATASGNLTTDAEKTVFGTTSVDGDLQSTTHGEGNNGGVSQSNGATMTVGGTANFIADTGTNQSAALNNDGNNFKDAVSFTATNGASWNLVNIKDDIDGLEFGNVNTGTLAATSTDGAISQTGSSTINVSGTSDLNAGNSDINLGNASNDFDGAVTIKGDDVTITDGTGGLTFSNVNASGNLDAESTGGTISQADNTTMVVGGDADIAASNNGQPANITIDNDGNDFQGAVSLNGASVAIKDDTGGLVFGDVNAAGDLDATSTGGDISQTGGGAVNVSGNTNLNSGANDINLGNDNSFGGRVSLAGDDANIKDIDGDLTFGNVTTTGNLDATSTNGNINQASGSTMQVAGDAGLTASNNGQPADITLDNDGNDFQGAVSLNGANVAIKDDIGGLVFGDVNAAGNLEATSTGGDINQTGGGAVNVSGNTNLDSGANDINLGNDNSFGGTVSLTGDDANIKDTDGDLTFGNVTTTGNLDATSANGDITQTGGSTLNISGNTSLDSGANDINLGNNNGFGGTVSLTGDDVNIKNVDGDLTFGNVNAGSLDASSTGGAIGQANGSTMQVTGNSDFTASQGGSPANITLANNGNDFGGQVSLNGNNASINDDNGGLILGNVTTSGTLDANSTGGDITQTPNTSLAVGGASQFDAHQYNIVLNNQSNDFGGPINSFGNNIAYTNGHGTLTVGNTNASGTLTVLSTSGNILQAGGTLITAQGLAQFTTIAPNSKVVLAANNHFFGGVVYRDTTPDQSPAVPMPTTTPVPVQPLPSMAPAGPTFSSTPNMAGGEVATGFGPESGITIAGDTTTTGTGKTGISVTLERLPADENQGQVTVVIPQELLMTQDSLSFELPAQLTKGLGPDAVISVSLVDGGALPSWLHFDPRTRTFTAKDVPAGGLPLEVVVTIDGKRTKVTITKSSRA